jgi:hypothetical protein
MGLVIPRNIIAAGGLVILTGAFGEYHASPAPGRRSNFQRARLSESIQLFDQHRLVWLAAVL